LGFQIGNAQHKKSNAAKKVVAATPIGKPSGRFNDLKKAFMHINEVKELSLSNIEKLPDGVYEFPNLTKLTIRNGLKKIDYRIGNLKSLEVLNLIDDEIPFLPEDIKNCTNLREIRIINCKFRVLTKELFELPKLERLILKNNNIEQIPCDFNDNYLLKEINLKYNKIKSLPDCLERVYMLQSLYLTGNPVDEFKGVWGNNSKAFKNLKTLSMATCNLTKIPVRLTNNLTYLDLSNNQIKDIGLEDILHMQRLTYLSVENNPLTFIDESLFDIKHLGLLQIDKNETIIDLLSLSNRVCISYSGNKMNNRLDEIKPCGKKAGLVNVYLYEPQTKIIEPK
jgi:Leucine-rich repeat (LRR) protein